MKRFFILVLPVVCSTICFCQSSGTETGIYPIKSATIFTGICIPSGDFANSNSEIGPAGNAKPGFYISGSVDLKWQFIGWRFEAGANFNPVNSSNLFISEMYPDAEVKHWTGTKLLSGPFLNFRLDKSSLRVGTQAGALWLRYPTIIFSEGNKIQPVPTANFTGQLFAEWSYPLSDKLSVGINAKYEFSSAEAKYIEIQKFYQLGNAFNLEYEAGRPFRIQPRMTNDPESGPIYTGWIGTSRSEGSVKQKINTLQIGVHIKFKLQATSSTAH